MLDQELRDHKHGRAIIRKSPRRRAPRPYSKRADLGSEGLALELCSVGITLNPQIPRQSAEAAPGAGMHSGGTQHAFTLQRTNWVGGRTWSVMERAVGSVS